MIDKEALSYRISSSLLERNKSVPHSWDGGLVDKMSNAGGATALLSTLALTFHDAGVSDQDIHDGLVLLPNLAVGMPGITSRVLTALMNLGSTEAPPADEVIQYDTVGGEDLIFISPGNDPPPDE
jgi:hypothetical protein